jgi:hypothetical protein
LQVFSAANSLFYVFHKQSKRRTLVQLALNLYIHPSGMINLNCNCPFLWSIVKKYMMIAPNDNPDYLFGKEYKK